MKLFDVSLGHFIKGIDNVFTGWFYRATLRVSRCIVDAA